MIWTHVSELAIDRLLAGEVATADAAAMRDHAARCTRCRALLADAEATQRAFVAAPPPLGLPVPIRRQRWIAPVSALAAAAVIVVAWPRDDAPAVRTKGTAIVGFFVAHGNEVRRGQLREPVVPGDRIQLFTTTTEPLWFAAIGDDAAGVRSVYVAPRRLAPGHEQVLPLAITLDATLGDEIVSGVFCAKPFEPLAIDLRSPPPGCIVDRFTLAKVPR